MVLQVYVPWKTWGQWGWNSLICGNRTSVACEPPWRLNSYFRRDIHLTFSRWHSILFGYPFVCRPFHTFSRYVVLLPSQATCWGWPPPLLLPVGEVKTRHLCRLEQLNPCRWSVILLLYIVFFRNFWLIVLSFLGLFHVYYYYYHHHDYYYYYYYYY